MKGLGKLRLGAEVEGKPFKFRLAQIWSQIDSRDTMYLATEDGKPLEGSIYDVCSNIQHYLDPAHALLIADQVDGQVLSFDVRYCKVHRKPLFWLGGAKVPLREITVAREIPRHALRN